MQKNVLIALAASLIILGCLPPPPERRSEIEPPRPKVSNNVENGVYKKYREDGTLFSEIPIKNGKRNGLAKDYYPDGSFHHEIEYVDGLKHGIAKTYYENGNVYEKSPYHNGLLHGVELRYRENGLLMAEVPYKNGKPGTGLKEYLRDGKEKTSFAKLIIEPVDKTQEEDMYTIKLYFDKKGRKKPEFYAGKLEDGRYLHEELMIIPQSNQVAELELDLPPSSHIQHEFDFIGVFYTVLGNPYVVHRKYNVNIRNSKPM